MEFCCICFCHTWRLDFVVESVNGFSSVVHTFRRDELNTIATSPFSLLRFMSYFLLCAQDFEYTDLGGGHFFPAQWQQTLAGGMLF